MRVTILLVLAASTAVAAPPCPGGSLATGPIQIAVADGGDAGLVRRACPRSEVAFTARGGALLDTPNFYGMIGAAGDLAGSWVLDDAKGLEVFGTLTVAQFRYVVNATITGSNLVLGHSNVGASMTLSRSDTHVVSAFARLHLPTSFEYDDAWPIGVEPGISAAFFSGTLSGHAGAALPIRGILSAGGLFGESLLSLVGGGAWTPTDWFSVLVELTTRSTTDAALDQLNGGLALRFRAGPIGIELDAAVPLAGASRWTGAGGLRFSYRL